MASSAEKGQEEVQNISARERAKELAKEKARLLGGHVKTQVLDRIVDRKQFLEWPESTLYCAIGIRLLVIIGVFLTVVGLIYGYFGGTLELSTATVKHTTLPFKRLVICPAWGQHGLNVTNVHMTEGNLFNEDYRRWTKRTAFQIAQCPAFEFYKFHHETPTLTKMSSLQAANTLGCMCLDASLDLAAQDIGKDYVRIGLNVAFQEDPDNARIFAVGMTSGDREYPSDWSYAPIGQRSVADLTLQENVYGSSPVTEGTAVPSYTIGIKGSFNLPQHARLPGTNTELVLSFGSYYTNQILDVSAVFSLLALCSFLAVFVATFNSLQVFDLCFPEVVDPEDPVQREPAFFFQQSMGLVSGCCRRKAP